MISIEILKIRIIEETVGQWKVDRVDHRRSRLCFSNDSVKGRRAGIINVVTTDARLRCFPNDETK